MTAEHHSIGNNPQNLLSPGQEQWNKWHVENHQRSWVEIEFNEKLVFKGIGFKSASDHPRKSPSEVKVHVWHMLELGWMRTDFIIEFPEIHGDTKKVKFNFHN